MAGPAVLGDLAVGESRSIDLSFTPPPSLSEGVYRFNLTFSSEGEAPQVLPVYAAITQSGQGGVLFKVSDAYTATVGKDGRLIAGLAGARIVLQNEAVASQVYELNTDLLGEAMFSDLPDLRPALRWAPCTFLLQHVIIVAPQALQSAATPLRWS